MPRVKKKGDTEKYILWYFEELQERGFVHRITTDPPDFLMLPKRDVTTGVSLRARKYTPDLIVVWKWKEATDMWCNKVGDFSGIRKPFVVNEFFITHIEVKPDVSYRVAKGATSMATFPLRRDIMFSELKTYVQLIKPQELFASTFTPARYLLTDKTKTGRKRVIHFHTRTLDEYLQLTDNLTKPIPGSKWNRNEVTEEDLGFEFREE